MEAPMESGSPQHISHLIEQEKVNVTEGIKVVLEKSKELRLKYAETIIELEKYKNFFGFCSKCDTPHFKKDLLTHYKCGQCIDEEKMEYEEIEYEIEEEEVEVFP